MVMRNVCFSSNASDAWQLARANLLAARGDWIGALADLETALTSRPNDPHLRLRRGDLLLRQGDWLRGLPDYEARLELPGG